MAEADAGSFGEAREAAASLPGTLGCGLAQVPSSGALSGLGWRRIVRAQCAFVLLVSRFRRA